MTIQKYEIMLSENVCLLGVKLESYNVVMQRRRILGAQIQYSDMADFSDYTTVYTIETTDIPYNINLGESKPHRYWRYMSADGTYGSIAELAFIDNEGNMIQGNPIACKSASTDAINFSSAQK